MARDEAKVPTRLLCHHCRRLWHVDGAGTWTSATPCDRCSVDCELVDDGQVHRFTTPTCGWSVICSACHGIWKGKLERLHVALVSYPEQVVDSIIRMAESAGKPGDVTNRK
jgi:hypothetical protein